MQTGKIDQNGNLWRFQRGKCYAVQCPYAPEKACGDWCALHVIEDNHVWLACVSSGNHIISLQGEEATDGDAD